MDERDLPRLRRTAMAARNLAVQRLADRAGVSKSARETDLSAPGSPRAVAAASLSRAPGLSPDTAMFGEIDTSVERADPIALREIAPRPEALKSDDALAPGFTGIQSGPERFAGFVGDAACKPARSIRGRVTAGQREARFVKTGILQSR